MIPCTTAAAPELFPMTGKDAVRADFVHGAKIAIDERGIEAGAYFAMTASTGMPTELLEPAAPRVIVLDRPFLYAIVSRTGQPLFLGSVARPGVDG